MARVCGECCVPKEVIWCRGGTGESLQGALRKRPDLNAASRRKGCAKYLTQRWNFFRDWPAQRCSKRGPDCGRVRRTISRFLDRPISKDCSSPPDITATGFYSLLSPPNW